MSVRLSYGYKSCILDFNETLSIYQWFPRKWQPFLVVVHTFQHFHLQRRAQKCNKIPYIRRIYIRKDEWYEDGASREISNSEHLFLGISFALARRLHRFRLIYTEM